MKECVRVGCVWGVNVEGIQCSTKGLSHHIRDMWIVESHVLELGRNWNETADPTKGFLVPDKMKRLSKF
jgi:hypothetical protein